MKQQILAIYPLSAYNFFDEYVVEFIQILFNTLLNGGILIVILNYFVLSFSPGTYPIGTSRTGSASRHAYIRRVHLIEQGKLLSQSQLILLRKAFLIASDNVMNLF